MSIFPGGESWIDTVSPEVRDEIQAVMSSREYSDGEMIYTQHDDCDVLFQVEHGMVKLSHVSPDGKEIVYTILVEGGCFGEMGLIDGVPRMTNAVAEGSTRLNTLRKADFEHLKGKYPEITEALLQFMTRRLRLSFSFIQEVAFFSLRQRLARRIHIFAEVNGKESDGAIEFENTLSQEELGKFLGASRQSINKELKNLQTAGLIEFKANKLRVLDMDALQDEFRDLVRYE